jgi:hypothetical protein
MRAPSCECERRLVVEVGALSAHLLMLLAALPHCLPPPFAALRAAGDTLVRLAKLLCALR